MLITWNVCNFSCSRPPIGREQTTAKPNSKPQLQELSISEGFKETAVKT